MTPDPLKPNGESTSIPGLANSQVAVGLALTTGLGVAALPYDASGWWRAAVGLAAALVVLVVFGRFPGLCKLLVGWIIKPAVLALILAITLLAVLLALTLRNLRPDVVVELHRFVFIFLGSLASSLLSFARNCVRRGVVVLDDLNGRPKLRRGVVNQKPWKIASMLLGISVLGAAPFIAPIGGHTSYFANLDAFMLMLLGGGTQTIIVGAALISRVRKESYFKSASKTDNNPPSPTT